MSSVMMAYVQCYDRLCPVLWPPMSSVMTAYVQNESIQKNVFFLCVLTEIALTSIILLANSADNKLMIFFLYFSLKTGFGDIGDNLHEMSKCVFREKEVP